MRKIILSIIFVISLTLVFSNKINAQADTLMQFCVKHLPAPYISDGQQYKTLLSEGELAEFNLTFYGGSTYRVVACSGLSDGNLIFTIYDKSRNELYTNRDHKNAPFWDFKFTSTVDCIIEAQLDQRGPKSGVAIILIGFKY